MYRYIESQFQFSTHLLKAGSSFIYSFTTRYTNVLCAQKYAGCYRNRVELNQRCPASRKLIISWMTHTVNNHANNQSRFDKYKEEKYRLWKECIIRGSHPVWMSADVSLRKWYLGKDMRTRWREPGDKVGSLVRRSTCVLCHSAGGCV